ncbi:MAG: hypothetical protein ACFCBW_15965 [Candidatus Competibacterales bacterium]
MSFPVAPYLGLALLGIVGLVGCSDDPHISAPGPVPAEPQRSGDPTRGYHALVNAPYVTCGVPREAFDRATAQATYSHGDTLPGRTGPNADLPYHATTHTTSAGVELVVSNCLGCHAGRFNGELVLGLGDETRDWTEDAALAAEALGRYVRTPEAEAEWRRWADRMAAMAPYTTTDTVGVNPANTLTVALMAHRDPETLAWFDTPLLEPPPPGPLPVSVPPLWHMAKKNALYYSTEGRGDHARHLILATLFCSDSVADVEAIDAYAPDILAYLKTLEAPDYPFAIDHGLATRGETVFEAHCSDCHGRYGAEESYPNVVVTLEKIGTDPLLAQKAVEAKRFADWHAQSYFGEVSRAAPAPGYIAPPLDGVWATAPFLHNGSVPTLEALLDSSQRPRYWTWSFDSRDFDQQALGWRFTALDQGKAAARSFAEAKVIYDTTLQGYSNRGHTYGDELTAAERRALLEYLKTL